MMNQRLSLQSCVCMCFLPTRALLPCIPLLCFVCISLSHILLLCPLPLALSPYTEKETTPYCFLFSNISAFSNYLSKVYVLIFKKISQFTDISLLSPLISLSNYSYLASYPTKAILMKNLHRNYIYWSSTL